MMSATRGPASLLSNVYPIAPTKSYRAHRVLGQVVAEFQLQIFQLD
jgi:hypothetical protein